MSELSTSKRYRLREEEESDTHRPPSSAVRQRPETEERRCSHQADEHESMTLEDTKEEEPEFFDRVTSILKRAELEFGLKHWLKLLQKKCRKSIKRSYGLNQFLLLVQGRLLTKKKPFKTERVTTAILNKRARHKEQLKKEAEAKNAKKLAKKNRCLPHIIQEIAKEDEEKQRRILRRVVAKEERSKSCSPRLGKHKQ